MDATYTMIGADGVQYGPITLDQLKSWIAEGRVTAETKILRSDTNSWLPAANYVELGLAQTAPAVAVASSIPTPPRPTLPREMMATDPTLIRQVKRGAGWFYAVAIFSIVNYFLMQSHEGFFLIGLGINIMTDNLVVTVIVAAIFGMFGYFAGRGHSWSFIAGMILYALDALIFLQVALWLPLAFHAYGLFRIFMGLKATFELKKLSR